MPIDWTEPEQRREYFRRKGKQYRRTHPRVTVTFSKDEFEWIEESARHFGKSSVAAHLRDLSLTAAKAGESGEPEFTSVLSEETVQEMTFLLRSMANNINQTARHLNEEALKQGRRIVAGKEASRTILEDTFGILRGLEEKLISYLP